MKITYTVNQIVNKPQHIRNLEYRLYRGLDKCFSRVHRPISAGRVPVSQSLAVEFADIPSRIPEVANFILVRLLLSPPPLSATMASFARPSLLRQTLATRSPLLRQNVGVSQMVAFHASARKQILPPLPRTYTLCLEMNWRCSDREICWSVCTIANLFSGLQSPSKEPVCDGPKLPCLLSCPSSLNPGLPLPHIGSVDFGWNDETGGRSSNFFDSILTPAIVNDPVPVPKPHPSEGSYHWTFERFVIS